MAFGDSLDSTEFTAVVGRIVVFMVIVVVIDTAGGMFTSVSITSDDILSFKFCLADDGSVFGRDATTVVIPLENPLKS